MTNKSKHLVFTGERFTPELYGDIALEHIHRYLFARKAVSAKIVLDIASGEGYGSAILASAAHKVISIDISQEAISHAQNRYQAENLTFITGACTAIPLKDSTIDVVVSFETIEHHDKHEEMMLEIKRVLRPGGLLILSSPDKFEYSDRPAYHNPHHVKELYRGELTRLLNSHFGKLLIYGQRVVYGSAILSGKTNLPIETNQLNHYNLAAIPGLFRSIYLIAIASDAELPSLSNEIFEQQLKEVEFFRVVAERDQMLADKDVAWAARLNNSAEDFSREITRIATERDQMLADKDVALSTLLADILPRVSVVIVNFNGIRFLSNLLLSLKQQTLQPYEIIVVDNASSDESVRFLHLNFPDVIVVESAANIGFAGGNNLGVKTAKSPLIALINNDTIADPQWLQFMVSCWMQRTARGERVGAISPKIRFLEKFLNFNFSSPVFVPDGNDQRSLGLAIDFGHTHILSCDYTKPIAISGFYGEEQWPDERVVRWTDGNANLMLPVPNKTGTTILRLVATAGNKPDGTRVNVFCEGVLIGDCYFNNGFSTAELAIPEMLFKRSSWVINNAGSSLDNIGNAGDIGINQLDNGQFDVSNTVDAFCGCSVLIGREQFISIGGFDERLFMYYEDSDLSWRMRNSGFLTVFEPRSVVRHVHAGSSVEWSPAFRYHVIRNQRLIGFKNAKYSLLPLLYASLLYSFLKNIIAFGFSGYKKCISSEIYNMSPNQIECKAINDAFFSIPKFLATRLQISSKTTHENRYL